MNKDLPEGFIEETPALDAHAAQWSEKLPVPISALTRVRLEKLLEGDPSGTTVENLAARMLEEAIARVDNEKLKSMERPTLQAPPLPLYCMRIMAAVQGGGRFEYALVNSLQTLGEEGWHALFWDITNDPKRTANMKLLLGKETMSNTDYLFFFLDLPWSAKHTVTGALFSYSKKMAQQMHILSDALGDKLDFSFYDSARWITEHCL